MAQEPHEVFFSKSNNQSKKKKSTKRARIIVRNLPFKNLSEKTLEDLFGKFGHIEEVKLLKKNDGKLVGCGFVQFENVSSAAKAISSVNLKELNGRKIICDWAVPKDTYLEKVKKFQQVHAIKEEKDESVKPEIKNEEIKFEIDKRPDTWASDDETENEHNDSRTIKLLKKDDDNDLSEGVSESDDSIYDDMKDFKVNSKTYEPKLIKSKDQKKTDRPSDAEDGRTVFIRNVPYSATNDDLRECVETYGPVEYALICIDKLTEHSKGTAFVKFKSEESASQCLKDSNRLYIDDAPLNVTHALSKEHLESKKSNKKMAKDSRNLYLIREGVIAAGSKAAAGVSASDMSKRLQLEQWKSQILKNLNMFVSKTRLVIHNLPPHYDDQKLRQLFLKYGNPRAVIKESKVMWEKNKLDAKGNHVSKEVGFVSFGDHEDALLALRNINNNPKIFTAAKRPIVAFSIENKTAINRKQKRVEKSRAALGIEANYKLSKLNRKQRRFIRRRQKIIEQRREAKKLKEGGKANVKPVAVPGTKRKASTETAEDARLHESAKKRRKSRESHRVEKPEEVEESKSFAGIASEPGKKVKLRTRFNLKKQAVVHSETLKKQKAERRKLRKGKRNLEPIKQPRQKKGKGKLLDDAKLSKLIAKHRESVQKSSTLKKWYES